MKEQQIAIVRTDGPNYLEHPRGTTPTVRDFVAVGFRHRRLLVISFGAILLASLLFGLVTREYESEIKILVKRERTNLLVSPQQPPPTISGELSQEELNSEAALLKSRDLLEKVVMGAGLHQHESDWSLSALFSSREQRHQRKIASAVRALENKLEVEPLRKTNLISVRYASSDPHQAAQLLQLLADSYVDKHLAVHRPAGQLQFFEQQTQQTQSALAAAEEKLANFTRKEGVVSPQLERDIVLQKLNDFQALLQQTQAAIKETKNRIEALGLQAAKAPARITTAVRTADNPELMQQLKSTLLNLELQRTELLSKYAPTYRPVQEVEAKIAQARAAIEAAERSPLRDETTDRDSTYEWIRSELAKNRSELKSLEARAAALSKTVAEYRETSRRLNLKGIAQQELLRTAKAQEENYLLYLRKREEARIADALDQKRILNVAIADPPAVPASPSRSLAFYGLIGLFLATTTSLGLVFIAEYVDPSFRTPDELRATLELPVLAAIPANLNDELRLASVAGSADDGIEGTSCI
jgi:uncharacterized protein involved in exopolysaccharide biosynthesis